MSHRASKILLFLLPLCAALTLQACFYGGGRHHYGPGYGYSPSPVYAAPPPAYSYRQPPPPRVYGDYDAHHVWHDRDWWVKNDRSWVEHHHPTWLSHGQDHHDHDHHDYDHGDHEGH